MSKTAHNSLILGSFVFAGIVGPAIYLFDWPSNFSPEILALIWPTRSLAAIEVNTGRDIAMAVAVGANVALFAILGILTILVSAWRFGVLALFCLVALAVVAMSFYRAGFSTAHMDWFALGFALLLYGSGLEIGREFLVRFARKYAVSDKQSGGSSR